MKAHALIICCTLLLCACRSDTSIDKPSPVTMTKDALGHYCQMNLSEHPGPKAQIHLEGLPAPLFFAQVRDAIAYQRMPEQSHAIRAIYVSDMAKAESWNNPGIDNWAPAEDAFYVVDSRMTGGMGAAELVPFGTHESAEKFIQENGGELRKLDQIPDSMVLAPVEMPVDKDGNFVAPAYSLNAQH
ncbi:MAG: nitrous oxide reductase accessory protein NosL [Hyphomicrobiaceae bacterium]|nr:nitrous oxide reductase accessory protein NosL [Hyphomicrobiaceae bacterium]